MVGSLISQSLINVLTRYYKGKGKHDWRVEKKITYYISTIKRCQSVILIGIYVGNCDSPMTAVCYRT